MVTKKEFEDYKKRSALAHLIHAFLIGSLFVMLLVVMYSSSTRSPHEVCLDLNKNCWYEFNSAKDIWFNNGDCEETCTKTIKMTEGEYVNYLEIQKLKEELK